MARFRNVEELEPQERFQCFIAGMENLAMAHGADPDLLVKELLPSHRRLYRQMAMEHHFFLADVMRAIDRSLDREAAN